MHGRLLATFTHFPLASRHWFCMTSTTEFVILGPSRYVRLDVSGTCWNSFDWRVLHRIRPFDPGRYLLQCGRHVGLGKVVLELDVPQGYRYASMYSRLVFWGQLALSKDVECAEQPRGGGARKGRIMRSSGKKGTMCSVCGGKEAVVPCPRLTTTTSSLPFA